MSAPQVGVSLRVFAIQFPNARDFMSPVEYKRREMEPIPFQVSTSFYL
jgi:peptide deformylase